MTTTTTRDPGQGGDALAHVATGYTPEQEAVLARVREDLLSGHSFQLAANSHRSRRLGGVLNRAAWAHVVSTMARMARESDAFAQIAAAVIHRINLYGTRAEECAHVYEAAVAALASGFDDVVGRAAPDAGRYRDHQRAFTLAERIQLRAWLAEAIAPMSDSGSGVGWALDEIARRERVALPSFPSPRWAS